MVEPERVIDIIILRCRHCDTKTGAVSYANFKTMLDLDIRVYCEPCRRKVEEVEHGKTLV